MGADGVGNVNFLEGDAEAFAENFCVGTGAFRGSKARHGDREDIRCRAIQQFHGPHSHQQRKARVQSPTDADDRGFGVYGLKTLGKAAYLDVEDELAALCPQRGIGWYKGVAGDLTGQYVFHYIEMEWNRGEGSGLKGRVVAALENECVYIDFCLADIRRKRLALRQRSAVFCNNGVTRECHILRGLSVAGAGVQIGTEQAGGLVPDQFSAVLGLADGLITGTAVHEYGGAAPRQAGRGRVRAPEVLTDLHAEDKAGHILAGECKGRAEGHWVAEADVNVPDPVRGTFKVALLIELRIVRKISFRDDAQDLSACKRGGHIVDFSAHLQRQSDDDNAVDVGGELRQLLETFPGIFQQGLLEEQVSAGVAGEAELREDQELGVCVLGDGGLNARGILPAVGEPNLGRETGRLDKTVFHIETPLCIC